MLAEGDLGPKCFRAEMTTMNFEVEISRTEWSSTEVWSSAREVLRERVYGGVRVGAESSAMAEDEPSVRVPVEGD